MIDFCFQTTSHCQFQLNVCLHSSSVSFCRFFLSQQPDSSSIDASTHVEYLCNSLNLIFHVRQCSKSTRRCNWLLAFNQSCDAVAVGRLFADLRPPDARRLLFDDIHRPCEQVEAALDSRFLLQLLISSLRRWKFIELIWPTTSRQPCCLLFSFHS